MRFLLFAGRQFAVTDQTQRGLTRKCQKLSMTMGNHLFKTSEPRRRSSEWTSFAKQDRTDFGKRLSHPSGGKKLLPKMLPS
jgi:hypothetical protein